MNARYRLIEVGSGGVEWRDIHNVQDAYAMQDSIIKSYLEDGYHCFIRPYFTKGYGMSHQWVEIYLVYAENGLTV